MTDSVINFLPSIDHMRTSVLSIIDHARTRIRNESEASRSLRLWILHHDNVYDFSPFLEVSFQCLVGGTIIQSTDEKFASAFRLSDFFLQKNLELIIFKEHVARLATQN